MGTIVSLLNTLNFTHYRKEQEHLVIVKWQTSWLWIESDNMNEDDYNSSDKEIKDDDED